MKTILTLLLPVLLYVNAAAQSNFYKLGIGGGFGVTQSFADLAKHDFGTAGYGSFDYYFTPFVSFGAEGQMGEVNGGDVNEDPNRRQFINSYKAFSLNARLYLGAIIDYRRTGFTNAIKGLYAGAGAGVIMNKMKFVVREKPDDGYIFPGSDSSKDLLVPLNAGITFNFPDRSGYTRYGFNLNYQANITLGEGLDGYNDSPIKFKSGKPDVYTYISVGLKYYFGPMGLSIKSLY
ncbi:outer membrane beta-barrel protein [Pedobacter heparinus]|uniref:outer membrane beta-barrel protein n=1 Tax=Pedobacter heparinus TaxID=984 RepID=UPI002930014A|nr:outer membrane beta-barrel protein [Pedobacter heparinus]